MEIKRLKINKIGPITEADIKFGDLTVLVGPQAVGKTIFLQFLNLILDYPYIVKILKEYSFAWEKDTLGFLDAYLGEGMQKIWNDNSKIEVNSKDFDWKKKITGKIKTTDEIKSFYIPAQRVITIETGWFKPFRDFTLEHPFVMKNFSEKVRQLLDSGLGSGENLFPQNKRLKSEIRKSLSSSIFREASVKLETKGLKRRLILSVGNSVNIPVMLWSTGQREFIPLLLGIYYLTPQGNKNTKGEVKYVIIEELEMGLHPKGIISVMFSIMELISRGYKVVLSTHSPQVLDIIWALQRLKEAEAKNLFADLFEMERFRSNAEKIMAETCLSKEYKVYYFNPEKGNGVVTEDISSLDPWSENKSIAGWGGLTDFSDAIHRVISKIPDETGGLYE